MNENEIAIVGAGLSGAVLARQLAENTGIKVVIFDSRDHVAGNCHTETDPETGIIVHRYGPHIFHTDFDNVWNFMTKYGKFNPYQLKIIADTEKGVYSCKGGFCRKLSIKSLNS